MGLGHRARAKDAGMRHGAPLAAQICDLGLAGTDLKSGSLSIPRPRVFTGRVIRLH
jgi:hypothetical protein